MGLASQADPGMEWEFLEAHDLQGTGARYEGLQSSSFCCTPEFLVLMLCHAGKGLPASQPRC